MVSAHRQSHLKDKLFQEMINNHNAGHLTSIYLAEVLKLSTAPSIVAIIITIILIFQIDFRNSESTLAVSAEKKD